MTRLRIGESDPAGMPFAADGGDFHGSDCKVTQLSMPARPAEVPADAPRALLLINDPLLNARAESMLRHAGLTSLSAVDASSALRCIDRDRQIGIIVIQQLARDCAASDFIARARQHAAGPLAVVLLAFDTSISVMRDIARLGGVEIVVLPSLDSEMIAASRAAAQWCTSARHTEGLRNSTLALINMLQRQAGKLLGPMDVTTAAPSVQPTPVTPPANICTELIPEVVTRRRPPGAGSPVDSETIHTLLRLQSLQQAAFGQGVIDVAAWVMLLDLLLSRINGKRLGVTALCIGAGVPLTTALRRIDELIASGLAERQADPEDRRRCFVSITDKGEECVRMYVEMLREEVLIASGS
jgi:DNA-binding MarR family transcriptional regulator